MTDQHKQEIHDALVTLKKAVLKYVLSKNTFIGILMGGGVYLYDVVDEMERRWDMIENNHRSNVIQDSLNHATTITLDSLHDDMQYMSILIGEFEHYHDIDSVATTKINGLEKRVQIIQTEFQQVYGWVDWMVDNYNRFGTFEGKETHAP